MQAPVAEVVEQNRGLIILPVAAAPMQLVQDLPAGERRNFVALRRPDQVPAVHRPVWVVALMG
jgi:hypothetical protein